MGESFFAYLQKLELIAFFSGYPLIYTIVFFIAGNRENRNITRLINSLSPAYALVGILYLGLQLKNLYPDYSIQHVRQNIYQPWLTCWALSSILFLIPALARMRILSLLHSLVFFFLLLKDLYIQVSSATGNSNVKNDMNVYTTSLLLNAAVVIFIFLLSILFSKKQKRA